MGDLHAARADVEAVKRQLEILNRAVGLQAEIDAAGLGDPLKRENAELRAEVEQLKSDVEFWKDRYERLRAENERLR